MGTMSILVSMGVPTNWLSSINCGSPLKVGCRKLKPVGCMPLTQVEEVNAAIMCEACHGKGWILCDFCKGKKTNVQAESKRIYRRCPSCRAVGYILCSKCKVFKCVTFPNYNDGEELVF